MASQVSANYFSTLGVEPKLGRTFRSEEDLTPGTHLVAILSERLWTTRFSRDPQIVGHSIRLNQLDCVIVGVMPAAFAGTQPLIAPDVWVPIMLAGPLYPTALPPLTETRARRGLSVLARLRKGASLEQARAEIRALGRHLAEAYPDTNRWRRLTVDFEEATRRQQVERIAFVSLAVVGLVLLIACANVAGLLLGRSEARRSEIAVRIALGASRRRLIRQLLTESAVLSLLAGGAGLVLAFWFIHLLPALVPPTPVAFNFDFRIDVRVLAFTLVVALLAAPVFGLTPALLASRPNIVPALKGEPERPKLGGRRLNARSIMVVAQIALSLMLLVSAGLLVRSYFNTRQIDPSFVPRPMVFCTMAPQMVGYTDTQARGFYTELLERLAARPGVEHVSMVRHLPLNTLFGGGATLQVVVPGYTPPPGKDAFEFRYNVASAGYFDTMGVRLLKGRDFDARDRDTSSPVVIVNRVMAERFWPHEDPIGQHLTLLPRAGNDRPRECQVVGVVQDTKHLTLTEAPQPYFYLPFDQESRSEMTVIVRGKDEAQLAALFRLELVALDRSMPTLLVMTMSEHLRLAVIFEQSLAAVVSVVAGVALFLSVIGLHGVVAFLVAQRTREIGIRVALGARPADVVADVLKQGVRFAAIGSAIGLLLAGIAGRLMSGTLYDVSAVDPLTYAGVTALVMLIALMAAWLPARGAARIDPIVALRCQ
jgi:predicted permease